MPIVDLQRRIREIGRIRIGDTVAATSKNGKPIRRPRKLTTFRLTARDEQVIRSAADLFGGTAEPWPEMEGQWQTTTAASVLEVIVPPTDMAFSQWYEQWSGGGCLKRCDGVRDVLRDCPCDCDPANRACSIHTRLSVILPDLPGLGVWRVDTQGYYAAVEIGGAVEVATAAAARGQMLPARLRLEQRKVLREGKTHKFAVPVLDLDVAPAALLQSGSGGALGAGVPPTTSEDAPAFDPVPEQAAIGPAPSIREQAEAPAAPAQRRANAAAPVPATGVTPRTAQEDGRTCSRCGQPWGEDPLIRGAAGESRYVHRSCPGGTDGAPAEPQAESEPMMTGAQSKKLHALLRQKFDGASGPARFPILSESLGREVSSTKEITAAEASTLIDTYEAIGTDDDGGGWDAEPPADLRDDSDDRQA